MSPLPGPCVLHLDVNAFFAALEQRDEPRLRGRPVAVGTGVVASCSYESRPFGVRTGMRLSDARRLCPQLFVVPGDYRRYEIAGRQILGICHEHTPRVEVAALDDLYLDLSALPWAEAEGLGRRLGQLVYQEVGVRVSLGLATNKLLAAVATQEVKERKARRPFCGDDLAVVPPGREREYLAPWPVEVLPGVGHKASEQLRQINVRRVAELAAVPASVLVGLFGTRGLALRQLACGVDPRAVEPSRPAQSVSRCTSFDPPLGEWPALTAMLDHLVERAASWLRARGQAARGVQVRLRYADHQWADGRAALAAPEDDDAVLRGLARERLGRLYVRRLPLRLLGVELSPLTAPRRQGELFPDPERERQRRLLECKDEVRRRFGFMALFGGGALELAGRIEHDRDNFRLRTPCLTR
jgi:DNA polymerase-4